MMRTDGDGNGKVDRVEEVEDVTTFRAGDSLFQSDGTAIIKVTKNGRAAFKRFRIRSTGFTEVIDKIRAGQPKPPTTAERVTADSPQGRDLGLQAGQVKYVYGPNTNDPKYVEDLAAWNRTLTLETINQALVGDFFDESGAVVPASNRDKRIKILEGMGLTTMQFNALTKAINELTELSEADRDHFFAVSSGAAPPTSHESPASTSNA